MPMSFFLAKQTNLNQLETLRQLVLRLETQSEEAALETLRSGIVPSLLRLKGMATLEVRKQANMALSLLGYAPPYQGKGLKVLAIDGGGTR